MDSGTPNIANGIHADPPVSLDVSVLHAKKRAPAKSRLQAYINEALQIEREEREGFAKRFPGVAPSWPPWPYLTDDPLASVVSKELSAKATLKDLRWRLRQFQYPYPASNAQKPTTFYSHSKAVDILEDVLTPPLLDDIRRFWWSQCYEAHQKRFRDQKKSHHGHPLSFHSELMYQLSGHLAEMDKLVKRYSLRKRVKSKGWFVRFYEYRRVALRRLLSEAAIVYPQIQETLKPASQIRTKEPKIEQQAWLFEKFDAAIKRRSAKGRERHLFAYNLTALICTPREIVLRHRLCPTPVTVRKNIQDSKK